MDPPQPEPGRKKLSTTAIVILVIVGVQLGPALVFLPAMLVIFLVAGTADDGPSALEAQVAVLGVLGVLLGGILLAVRNDSPVRPGHPAGPRRVPYDLRGSGGLGARLRLLPANLETVHRAVLWGLVVVVSVCALGILAAVVAGPEGPQAALWALLLLGGWLLTLLAYLFGGYRGLLPAGVALMAYGLLLHSDAVARAWGVHLPGSLHAVGLLAVFWIALCPVIEAQRRTRQAGWLVATVAAAVLTAAFPAVALMGASDGFAGRLAVGLSSAGLVLGLSGCLAFIRVGPAWRVATLVVAGVWAFAAVAGALAPADLRNRLVAATILVVLVTTIATLTAFFVQRPRAITA